LRDGRQQRLEREADRLAMLLETARAESRASGLQRVVGPADGPADGAAGLPLRRPAGNR
jgi:Tfp pilus assembly protein FimT